jgi:predicted NAD/FAD-binding protein
MEICIEYPNLIKLEKKYSTLYMETEMHFSVAGEIKTLSFSEILSGCLVSRRSINTTRTRRHYTVYVHCLSFNLLPTNEYDFPFSNSHAW